MYRLVPLKDETRASCDANWLDVCTASIQNEAGIGVVQLSLAEMHQSARSAADVHGKAQDDVGFERGCLHASLLSCLQPRICMSIDAITAQWRSRDDLMPA